MRTWCPLLSNGWAESKISGELHGLVLVSCLGNNEISHLTSQIPPTHNHTETSEPEAYRALSALSTTHKISEMQPPLCNHYSISKMVVFTVSDRESVPAWATAVEQEERIWLVSNHFYICSLKGQTGGKQAMRNRTKAVNKQIVNYDPDSQGNYI